MEWISVNDKLPEDEVDVLFVVKDYVSQGYINRTMYKNEKQYFKAYTFYLDEYGQEVFTQDDVTYWMPLPEAPKTQNK